MGLRSIVNGVDSIVEHILFENLNVLVFKRNIGNEVSVSHSKEWDIINQ